MERQRNWRACLLGFALSVGNLPFASAQNILRIAVEDDAAPWSRRDGTGYANDEVRAAYAAVGVRVAFDVVPYVRCKREVIEGQAAACFSMSPAPELSGVVQLSKTPLFTCRSDYFYNRTRPLTARQESELRAGQIVGIVAGYEYPPSLAALRARGVRFEEARSEEANLRKLAQGRLDAALINHNAVKSVERMLADAGVSAQITYGFTSGELVSHIGFSRRTVDGERARELFEKGFAAIQTNGELAAIEQRWKGLSNSKPAP